MVAERSFEISLGPAPTNWGRTEFGDFYADVVHRPHIHRVYVGEVVCMKRRLVTVDLLRQIRDIVEQAHGVVVLSTPAVIVAEADLERIAALAEVVDHIEANNVGVVALWKERFPDKSLVLGPYLNVYNARAATFWRDLGAERLVLPIDAEWPVVTQLAELFPGNTEMVLFGRPALAFSWRCYTARAYHKLGRDCDFNCCARRQVHLQTLDDEQLLTVNGSAVYPRRVYCALDAMREAQSRGVSTFRIEPACGGADAALAMIDGLLSAVQTGQVPEGPPQLDTEYMASRGKMQRLRVEECA